jgi:hypothetical protein
MRIEIIVGKTFDGTDCINCILYNEEKAFHCDSSYVIDDVSNIISTIQLAINQIFSVHKESLLNKEK